jgi:hypothetical protein
VESWDPIQALQKGFELVMIRVGQEMLIEKDLTRSKAKSLSLMEFAIIPLIRKELDWWKQKE